MKLMKIFGMVFALHVALACVLVLIQGCRSTPARTPDAAMTPAAPAPSPSPVAETGNWSNQAGYSAPTPVDFSGATSAATPVEPISGLSPAERARTSPTRPANPDAYISTGVPNAVAPPPPQPVDYVVRSGDSLWKIAQANNITTAELQRMNPQLKSSTLRPGMMLKVPGTAATSSMFSQPSPAAPVTSAAATSTYTVRAGDSLSKIAARNGTTVSALREVNNLRSDVIQIGQSLVIPGGGATEPASSAPDFSGRTLPGAPDAGGNQVKIVLQSGDTLGEIARKFDVTVGDLMAANNITDPRRVRAGQELVIPGFQAVGTGEIPRPAPAPARPAAGATTTPQQPPPPRAEPPRQPRPSELDALPPAGEAPPVLPLDDPVPAP